MEVEGRTIQSDRRSQIFHVEDLNSKRDCDHDNKFTFSLESMGKDLEGVKCPPGQIWAFNKNPRCSLSFSDAVFENTKPTCPDAASNVSIS